MNERRLYLTSRPRSRILGVALAGLLCTPHCASTEPATGETHFLCSDQAECDDKAPGTECRGGYCRPREEGGVGGGGGSPSTGGASSGGSPSTGGAGSGGAPMGDASAGSGGRTGAGGASCDDGTATFCVDGAGGGAGSIGYESCAFAWVRELEDVECPSDAGGSVTTLSSWCQHVIAQIEERRHEAFNIHSCALPLLKARAGEPLDPDKVCNPELAAGLRACSDGLDICERLPLCADGGTYGCNEIRQQCPALTAQQCESGFDSATNRNPIRECLTSAPASEDCVATFYRCVWGL